MAENLEIIMEEDLQNPPASVEVTTVTTEPANTDIVPPTEEEIATERTLESVEAELAQVAMERDELIANNQKIADIFAQHPDGATFLSLLSQGVISGIDFENMTFEQGNPEEYARMVEEMRQDYDRYRNNLTQSDVTLQEFLQDIEEADRDELVSKATAFIAELQDGINSREFLDVLKRGLLADREVATAAERAALDATNARIEERLSNVPADDGLPNLGAGGDAGSGEAPVSVEDRMLMNAIAENNRYR